MGSTKYFNEMRAINERFSNIKHGFSEFISSTINTLKKNSNDVVCGSNLKAIRDIIDYFDKYINELKEITDQLRVMRTTVDKRSFFKHGNIKAKLDQILSIQAVVDLRKELKLCNQALNKVDIRKDYSPLTHYLQKYGVMAEKEKALESFALKNGGNTLSL